jgi:hypothetical protein
LQVFFFLKAKEASGVKKSRLTGILREKTVHHAPYLRVHCYLLYDQRTTALRASLQQKRPRKQLTIYAFFVEKKSGLK